jgi:NAD-dependent deacetylase
MSESAGLQRAAAAIAKARRLAVLSGAGVSAESGVPTFRDGDGWWQGHRVEDLATPEAFARNPRRVWHFYHARREQLRNIQPNPGHYSLVRLEEWFGENMLLATQNIDGLHTLAGNQRVAELHGNIRRTRCLQCGVIEDRGLEALAAEPPCPGCGGQLRPDVVWFHEPLNERVVGSVFTAAENCDCLLVVGTSAVVFPAATMIPLARQTGGVVIEINLTPTAASRYADIGLYGSSGELLPLLCEEAGIHHA